MKTLCAVFLVTLTCPLLKGQKPAAQAAWKPENEVQRTAEIMRLSLQRDFEEVVLIHYTKTSAADHQKLVADQLQHAKTGTKFTEDFAAALTQAMASKRCDALCGRQIKPLLDDFAEMGDIVANLNQKKVKPELLPQQRARFNERLKSSSAYIRAIHLTARAAPAS